MAVIEFDHVSKGYRLGASRTSLRETVPHLASKLFSRNGAHADNQIFWALDDVSFNVEQGEVLGIIGHNGAGKSTILKLLSKVTYPDSGNIKTKGRMAALIELGAGFHPDLSGRENVYLNGSILGLKRHEIDAQFDNIVEFAGLEKFIDTPIKRYSSGMYVRLAFAVAAHVRADILLVDEVLSVGDMAFQQKSLAKMNELRDSGATIIFISHNMWSVSRFCRRTFLLNKGHIEAEGNPDEIIEIYRRKEREDLLNKTRSAEIGTEPDNQTNGETAITRVELLDKYRQPKNQFDSQEGLFICAHYVAPDPIESPRFLIRIRRADGLICYNLSNKNGPEFTQRQIHGVGTFQVYVDPLQLVPDIYSVDVFIADAEKPLVYASRSGEIFHINGNVSSNDTAGIFEPHSEWIPERNCL